MSCAPGLGMVILCGLCFSPSVSVTINTSLNDLGSPKATYSGSALSSVCQTQKSPTVLQEDKAKTQAPRGCWWVLIHQMGLWCADIKARQYEVEPSQQDDKSLLPTPR